MGDAGAPPDTVQTALAALLNGTAALQAAVAASYSANELNDEHSRLSLSTPLFPSEETEAKIADATITTTNPRGTDRDPDKRRAVADYHKKRGRKIAEVKRQLPHDGYINDTLGPDKHDAYEFHPITSKDLITEADVNKAETKINSALQDVRWNREFSFDHNVYHVFKHMICTQHFDVLASSPDYWAVTTGNPLRYFLQEHYQIKVWRENDVSVVAPAGSHTHTRSIPFRPPQGDGSTTDPSFTFIWNQVLAPVTEATQDLFEFTNNPGPGVGTHPALLHLDAISHDEKRCIAQRYGEIRGPEIIAYHDKPNSVLAKYRNNGFERLVHMATGDMSLRPINPLFQRDAVLSQQEFRVLSRCLFGYLLRFVEQSTIGRRELGVYALLEQMQTNMSTIENPFYHALALLKYFMPESRRATVQSLRMQYTPMFTMYDPSIDAPHHLAEGILEIQDRIKRYGKPSDQLKAKQLLDDLLLRIDSTFESVPEQAMTPFNRAWERFVEQGRLLELNDSAAAARVDPDIKAARKDIHYFIQYALDLQSKHKPAGIRTERSDKFMAHVDNEPVPGHRSTNSSYLTDVEVDNVEMLANSLETSPLARGARAAQQRDSRPMSRQPMSFFNPHQRGRMPSSSASSSSSRPDPFQRGRMRNAIRDNVRRRSVSSERRSLDSRRGRSAPPLRRPSSLGPPPPGHRRDFEHPHLRKPVASLSAGSTGSHSKTQSRRDKEWIPRHVYSALRDVRDQLQKVIDAPNDLQNAMSISRASKAKIDMVLQTSELLNYELDDVPVGDSRHDVSERELDSHGVHESKHDDDYADNLDEVDRSTEVFDIAEAQHLDMRDAARVQEATDSVLLHLESFGPDLSDADRDRIIHQIIDDMPLGIDMLMTETADTDNDELTLVTRVTKTDNPTSGDIAKDKAEFLGLLSTEIHASLIASNYDSCGSQCFETHVSNCVPNSFKPFGDNGPKIKTTVGLGAADGMALRRVHAAITPEMVESAAEHGIDLSDTSVVTVLVPPIICNKFDGDYSILGGPVCKSIGIRYEQDAWCHNPDYVVWHRQPLLQTKLHHKRNGLPYFAFKKPQTRFSFILNHSDRTCRMQIAIVSYIKSSMTCLLASTCL